MAPGFTNGFDTYAGRLAIRSRACVSALISASAIGIVTSCARSFRIRKIIATPWATSPRPRRRLSSRN